MHLCLYPRTQNRGPCQKRVHSEGDRCHLHGGGPRKDRSGPATRSKEERNYKLRKDIANVLAEASEKSLPKLAAFKRSIEDESHNLLAFIRLQEHNALKIQELAEANEAIPELYIQANQAFSQLGILEQRRADVDYRRIEISREERRLSQTPPDKVNILFWMMIAEQMREAPGFDIRTPGTSLDAYCEWLGETTTVEDVLADKTGRLTANAPWEMQREIMNALFWPEEIGKPLCRKVVVLTGNGMGKSYFCPRVILQHMLFRYPSKLIVTGPRLTQIRDTISAPLQSLHAKLGLPGEPGQLRWIPDEDNQSAYCIFTSAQNTDRMQGHHGRVLIIGEEASGIPQHIYDAFPALMAGEDVRLLLIGNPLRRQGEFYRLYADTDPDDPYTHVIQRSAFDHPNLIHADFIQKRGRPIYPGGVSLRFIQDIKRESGENSKEYQVRVNGLPPEQDSKAMIPLHLVMESRKYTYDPRERNPEEEGPSFHVEHEVICTDPSGQGDDLTVIGRWQWGPQGMRYKQLTTMDTSNHTEIADYMWNAKTLPIREDSVFFSADTIGEGSGIMEMLEERGALNHTLFSFKANRKPEGVRTHDDQPLYANLEAETWAFFAKDLRKSYYQLTYAEGTEPTDEFRIDLPDDSRLSRELTERDQENDGERIKLQPKKEFAKLLGHSPDRAECCIVGHYGVRRAIQLIREAE